MSIFEKAIAQLESAGERRDRTAALALEARKTDLHSPEQSSENFVDTHQITQRGPLSALNNPEIEREFRFLKQPLLAKVFGSPV